ncbi:MAG: PspC domain-containing protein, partial [Prolixibacteraceae bacterium]|nr:PspC domain-containing protein [Prolixibacteraceae bacterium]
MKKTLTINISGTVFHIDEDAYDKLKSYLAIIGNHFRKEVGGQEIINDIEARMAELFAQRTLNAQEVVNLDMVLAVEEIMGLPDDFLDAEEATGSEEKRTDEPPYQQRSQAKRLYRDPDSRVLGGVCSGLSHYMKMDKVLARVLFFILFLITSGAAALIYLILWIAVPKARTTSQKLEMRGEKINIGSIGKSVKEEFS